METKNGGALPPVSETLFIPLAARAAEAKRDNPIIADPKSAEIIQALDLNGKITDGGQVATLGILARTRVIDDEVSHILAQKQGSVIINLGVGLDTRITRVDNAQVQWVDLDLPDVIRLRSRFFSESKRVRFISKSILDETWIDEIHVPDGSTVILIAEGLLMYFTREEVTQILALLSKRFSGAHMFFDVVHSYFVNKKISSSFLWGIDHAMEIEKLHPNVQLIQAWSAGDMLKERQPPILRLLNFLPATRNRSQILHIRFK